VALFIFGERRMRFPNRYNGKNKSQYEYKPYVDTLIRRKDSA